MLSLKKPYRRRPSRYLSYKRIAEQYPEVCALSFCDDEIALKLKYLALFFNSPYIYWPMGLPRKSYFFRRDFIHHVIDEVICR